MAEPANRDPALLMNGIYRWQRHIYDPTRKYYLLGRDRMIESLEPPAGGTLLEIGCGTARNLVRAAEQYADARLFGIDISREMLKTAGSKLSRKGLEGRISLALVDASELAHRRPFCIDRFDRVFISYALSMIPGWRAALRVAADLVAPGGQLHVLDFGQQDRLPAFTQRILKTWLSRFHVAPRPDLEMAMAEVAGNIGGELAFTRLYFDYARYGIIRRT